jgi:hypothetical protein
MAEGTVHGPIDFVLIEFDEGNLTGRTAEELVRLVEAGVVWIYDLMIVGKEQDGSVYALDIVEEADRVGTFGNLATSRSGLLSEEDMLEAAGAMEAGTLAALVVYENLWAIPFVAAARESGGELVASGRIPAPVVMEALDALAEIV